MGLAGLSAFGVALDVAAAVKVAAGAYAAAKAADKMETVITAA